MRIALKIFRRRFTNRQATLIGGYFLALTILLTFDTWLFGQYSIIPLHDNGDGPVPNFWTIVQNIIHDGYSRWNFMQLCGLDDSMSFDIVQTATPFYALPKLWLAHGLYFTAQVAIGVVGMYWLCRITLGLATFPSLVAATAFVANIHIIDSRDVPHWWWNNWFEFRLTAGLAIPALPLAALLIDRFMRCRQSWPGAAGALAVGAGYGLTQFSLGNYPYLLLALLLFNLLFTPAKLVWRVAVLSFFIIGSMLPLLANLLFAPALYLLSHRIMWDGLLPSLPLIEIANRLIGSLSDLFYWGLLERELNYLGLAVIAVILATLPDGNIRERNLLLRAVAALMLVFVLTQSSIPSRLLVVALIPIQSLRRVDLSYIWGVSAQFFIAVMIGCTAQILSGAANAPVAGDGTQHPRSWGPWLAYAKRALLAIMLASVVWPTLEYRILEFTELLANGTYATNFQSRQLMALRENTRREPPYRVISLGISPSFANTYGFETADGHDNLFPLTYAYYFARVLKLPLAHSLSDPFMMPVAERVGNRAFIAYSGPASLNAVNADLLGLANVKYVISVGPLEHQDLELVDQPAKWTAPPPGPGARWVIEVLKGPVTRLAADWQVLGLGPAPLYYTNLTINFFEQTKHIGRSYYIYKLKQSAERAFVVHDYETLDQDQVFRNLDQAPLESLLRRVTLEQDPPMPQAAGGPIEGDEVESLGSGGGQMAFRVRAGRAGILVVSVNHSPFWRAEINGKAAPILRAYGTFMAVVVPAGSSDIRFRYEPPGL